MQRYFVSSSGWEHQHVTLTGEDVHHITKVMRMKTDDEIICCTPEGQAALCKIIEITHDMVTCYIVKWLDEDKELPAQVTIVQGLPKGDKMELVIQKGTELGASRFIPFEAERSIVKWDAKKAQKKQERYQKIAKEASEQSHRTMIPTVTQLSNLKQLIEEGHDYDWKLIAYEDEAKAPSFRSLKEVIPFIKPSERVMVVIGPEGGFSENEVHQLTEASFLSVRLGPRILRTETAPAYILSAISYQLEELR
ncbi:16S rRNA (uracil(1498)-N(3))-methyltransferase [Pontibacillus yanchengensis]|uniref:Ribosomal RNA small subunit methyltransferase E n=1 Tax=Pontibacillus yanchengensis Y32 TaxID=1385514 RepID=A0A0A2TFD7_9BACI|nr:16S rRNA (uracil(1498)-N(3))-methyltransferase [Pontibacillus yanchengensis]KGP73148.1 16S rRNA methyltransferase [Pontibacillus yanchengensis Y32]